MDIIGFRRSLNFLSSHDLMQFVLFFPQRDLFRILGDFEHEGKYSNTFMDCSVFVDEGSFQVIIMTEFIGRWNSEHFRSTAKNVIDINIQHKLLLQLNARFITKRTKTKCRTSSLIMFSSMLKGSVFELHKKKLILFSE